MLWSTVSLPYWLPMMAGYPRLIRADEEGSIAALKACRDATIPIGERYGGCMVGAAGDGVLWEFPSVTAAVTSAIEAQTLMTERNAGSGRREDAFSHRRQSR